MWSRVSIEAVKAAPLSAGRTTTFWFNWSGVRVTPFPDLWKEVEDLFDRPGMPATIKRRSLRKTEKSMRLALG